MIEAEIQISVAGDVVWTGSVPLNVATGLIELSGMDHSKEKVDVPDDTATADKKQ